MSERYVLPSLSVMTIGGLLLACGIYERSGWNILFLSVALLSCFALIGNFLFRKRKLPESVGTESPDPEEEVFLVIGPYVARWFITRNDKSLLRYERQCLWLAARDAGELIKHLSRLSLQPQKVKITLFFPFLPDGHDTAALAISALATWTRTLQSMVLPEPLPCIFAIYACFSQQRYAWDPDRVIWSGEMSVLPSGGSLDNAIAKVLATFNQPPRVNDAPRLQRHSTLIVLRQWLNDTQLTFALDALLNSGSVSLSHCLLADYGCGFIRHGAWARWLEEQYAVLPALATSRIELSFPEIPACAQLSPASTQVISRRPAFRLFLPLMIGLLASGSMLVASVYEGQRSEVTEALLAQFLSVSEDNIGDKFSAFDRLEAHQKMLKRCANSAFFQNWGFAKCGTLLNNVTLRLNHYKPWIIYSSAEPLSLFASGNYTILPARMARLQPLAALVRKNPSVVFKIVGHSDNSGNEQDNLRLSELRAREIRDWLIQQTGAEEKRFVLSGMGAAFPLTSNATPEGKEVNRRIEVIPLHTTMFSASEKIN